MNAVEESVENVTQEPLVYLTNKQVCERFNIKPSALREWVKRGLKCAGYGKMRRFLVADVVAFLNSTK